MEAAEANEQASDAERRGVVLMVAAETAAPIWNSAERSVSFKLRRRPWTSSGRRWRSPKTRTETAWHRIWKYCGRERKWKRPPPRFRRSSRRPGNSSTSSRRCSGRSRPLSSDLEQPRPIPTVPGKLAIGIPSDLLRRRPDIQAAERQLAASTAGVGVATAQLFPQMVLGGTGGLASRNFGDVVQRQLEILRCRTLRQLDPVRRRTSPGGCQA